VPETLAYYAFPKEHWRRIRTNNPLERIMREIRRRHLCGRRLPRRQFGNLLGGCQAAPYSWHALVDQTISGHGAAQAAQRHDRLTGAGHRPKVRKILGTTNSFSTISIFITIQHFMNRPEAFPITSGGCALGCL
jgi:mutator family transposase